MRELTVGAMVVRALLDFAASRGGCRATLAARSRLDTAALEDPDGRVPFSQYVALMRAGQALCNDPALALHFGELVDASEVSIAHAFGAVGSITDAIAEGNRYAPLGIETEVEGGGTGGRVQLCREAGQLWLVDARRDPNAFPELTESGFARMVCTARKVVGTLPVFLAVHVTHAAPPYYAEYERIFRVPVAFGSDRNALRLDPAVVASLRLPAPSPYVSKIVRGHADALLARLNRSRSVPDRVEAMLKPRLAGGDVGMGAIAGELCVSRQTLFRQLKAEGVSFEQVLDQLRREVSLEYLGARKASVKETARLVGYSDSAAFSRAFKRWTGFSPRNYVFSSPSTL